MTNIEALKIKLDEYAAMVNDTDAEGLCNTCSCCVEAKVKEIWELVSDAVEDDFLEEGYLAGQFDTEKEFADAAAAAAKGSADVS